MSPCIRLALKTRGNRDSLKSKPNIEFQWNSVRLLASLKHIQLMSSPKGIQFRLLLSPFTRLKCAFEMKWEDKLKSRWAHFSSCMCQPWPHNGNWMIEKIYWERQHFYWVEIQEEITVLLTISKRLLEICERKCFCLIQQITHLKSIENFRIRFRSLNLTWILSFPINAQSEVLISHWIEYGHLVDFHSVDGRHWQCLSFHRGHSIPFTNSKQEVHKNVSTKFDKCQFLLWIRWKRIYSIARTTRRNPDSNFPSYAIFYQSVVDGSTDDFYLRWVGSKRNDVLRPSLMSWKRRKQNTTSV